MSDTYQKRLDEITQKLFDDQFKNGYVCGLFDLCRELIAEVERLKKHESEKEVWNIPDWKK